MADYPNRSDLRNPATRKVAFTGQTYGEGAAQARSQQQVAPGSAPAQVEAQRMARPVPGGAGDLLRPTERPDEPITAGADFGPGPSSMEAGIIPRRVPQDNVIDTLRALYAMFPDDDLLEMLNRYGNRGF